MPNRILRDHTDSYRFEHVSAEGERLFHRLIMKVDDYGRYNADPRLIRSGCFPLLASIRDADISRWLAECQKAGLIAVYVVQERSYLAIINFRQRLRTMTVKFPPMDGKPANWQPDDSTTLDGQTTVNGPSSDGVKRRGNEEETNPQTPKGGREAVPSAFDRFWSAYPRKEGKQEAGKSFLKVGAAECIDTILAALERHKQKPDWTKDSGQFIPHPKTWLNQRRWEDEGTQPMGPKKPRYDKP